jgi:hypothetical protein
VGRLGVPRAQRQLRIRVAQPDAQRSIRDYCPSVTAVSIPSRWLDLPEAPFVAQIRNGKPVLVARSSQTFSQVGAGCVVEVNGKAHVIATLIEELMTQRHFWAELSSAERDSEPHHPDIYQHLSQRERCPSDSFFALTGAVAVDRNGAKNSSGRPRERCGQADAESR